MQTKTKTKFTGSDIGCIIDGSSQSADYINEETISFAESYGFDASDFRNLYNEDDEDFSQILSETADDAVNFLHELDGAPYCSFYFEDNSLFYAPSIESAKEDVEFISSREQDEPDSNYRGEWLHVSDHGNCTLYVRDEIADNDGNCKVHDAEIWGVV